MATFLTQKRRDDKLVKATGDTSKQRYLSYLIFQKKKKGILNINTPLKLKPPVFETHSLSQGNSQTTELSSGGCQGCGHFWISLLPTLPCYTGSSVLKAYLNLQNMQESAFQCTTSTTNTNMNILVQELWVTTLFFHNGFAKKDRNTCFQFQIPGAGARQGMPHPWQPQLRRGRRW